MRSPRRHALLAWWLLWLAPAAQAFGLHSDDAGLLVEERVRALAVMDEVDRALPAGLRAALPGQVSLRWVDDLPAHVAGRAFNGEIRLRKGLLASGIAPREAQATLIHELVHVADRGRAGGWSGEARLRELAGWQRRPWKLGRSPNRFSDRSPDAYERRSAAEYLAVNVEHWLLDDDYACRRPALAAWMVDRFGAPPVPSGTCSATLPLLQAGEEEGVVTLAHLDPARVYAVDYLFAEGGSVPMSRWGHSMLRLVICRPGRPPGPACRLDLDQHRVLSFRAFVGDVEISSWRGLSGGYPSRLFVLPLQQVVDEYTKMELRGLASLPLQLSSGEIAGLLERTAQVHWSYDGRYYFIGNNCAVETAKLLQAGIPALQEAGVERISPRGLRRRLQRLGRLDESVLQDRGAAIRDGYYFESRDRQYATLFDAARKELALPVSHVQAWLQLDAAERSPWLQRGGVRATAGLLLLEQAAYGRAELRARDTLKRAVLKLPHSDGALQLRQLLQQAGQWLQPATLLAEGGYGLPQAGELAGLQERLQEDATRTPEAWKQLRQQMRATLPVSQQQELEVVQSNLDALGAHLREQAAQPPR